MDSPSISPSHPPDFDMRCAEAKRSGSNRLFRLLRPISPWHCGPPKRASSESPISDSRPIREQRQLSAFGLRGGLLQRQDVAERFDEEVLAPHHRLVHSQILVDVIHAALENAF